MMAWLKWCTLKQDASGFEPSSGIFFLVSDRGLYLWSLLHLVWFPPTAQRHADQVTGLPYITYRFECEREWSIGNLPRMYPVSGPKSARMGSNFPSTLTNNGVDKGWMDY